MYKQDDYQKALNFAAKYHGNQKYGSDQLPYVTHLALVASEVIHTLHQESNTKLDPCIVQIALLHDVLEDTPVSKEQLAKEFGDDVANAVEALSKDNSLDKDKQMVDSLTRILGLSKLKREACVVKMCDRIVNLQKPPSFWKTKKIAAYKNEAAVIFHYLAPNCSNSLLNRFETKLQAYPPDV